MSRQPVDLTLELTINADAADKLTGIINSISACQRWCKSHSIRTAMMTRIIEQIGLRKSQGVTNEKNRVKKYFIQLENLITHLNENNHFSDNYGSNFLFSILTDKVVRDEIGNFLLL